MPAIACAKCFKFMRVKRNGVYVEEGAPYNEIVDHPTAGRVVEKWGSYKLWIADLYECPSCGAQTISGFGSNPIIEHYEVAYAAWLELARQSYGGLLGRIDDCGGAKP